MAEPSSVLAMRILGMGSVTRKLSVDTMRLKRLANINGGQYGREYPDSSILYVSLGLFILMALIGERVLEVSMAWSLLSMSCSLPSKG